MSTSSLTAKLVSVWKEQDLTGAAIAEQPDSSGWNLIFLRGASATDKTRVADADTYCICTESGASAYGGIVKWGIDGKQLSITLDAQTSGDLGVAPSMTIELPPDQVDSLKTALGQILA